VLIIMTEIMTNFLYLHLDQSFDNNNQYIIKNERLVRQKYKQSERSSHQNLVHMQPNKLYEAVNKMNCQLERFRLNCPIHNSIF